MGRFHHRHDEHEHHEHEQHEHEHEQHEHEHHEHEHEHDHDHEHEHEHGSHPVGDHSGYTTGSLRVDVLAKILGENDRTAEANRADFRAAGVRVVNVMSSPGAGKTALLAEVFRRTPRSTRFGVIEGDIETSLDADKLAATGVAVSLLNTAAGFGGECHLDAPMVRRALAGLTLDDLDVVVIENVGNLVCPAEFDVGEDARLMVYSVTEGEEKPLKYPVMFRSADAIVVNKIDLLPYLDFDLDAFLANLEAVNPGVTVLQASARTGEGIDALAAWLIR
jgi:hydrogenase nickel incorporation protein HypB